MEGGWAFRRVLAELERSWGRVSEGRKVIQDKVTGSWREEDPDCVVVGGLLAMLPEVMWKIGMHLMRAQAQGDFQKGFCLISSYYNKEWKEIEELKNELWTINKKQKLTGFESRAIPPFYLLQMAKNSQIKKGPEAKEQIWNRTTRSSVKTSEGLGQHPAELRTQVF